MGGCKLRGWCGFAGLAIGFFLGWLVFLSVYSVFFFSSCGSFLYTPVYFWELCSLLLNILLLLIKREKKNIVRCLGKHSD